jgi:hypothetical protein
MAKYWVEFQYAISGLPDDVELSGFSSLPYEMDLTPKAILDLKQFIADRISEKALKIRGLNVAEVRKQHYEDVKGNLFYPDYSDKKDWGIKAEEINLTLVLKLE